MGVDIDEQEERPSYRLKRKRAATRRAGTKRAREVVQAFAEQQERIRARNQAEAEPADELAARRARARERHDRR